MTLITTRGMISKGSLVRIDGEMFRVLADLGSCSYWQETIGTLTTTRVEPEPHTDSAAFVLDAHYATEDEKKILRPWKAS